MRIATMIAVGATVAVVGGVFAYMEYTRTPASANSRNVEASVTAEQLYTEFQQDEAAAEQKYVGTTEQVIEVSGEITSMNTTGEGITNVILGTGDALGGVVCEFNENDVPDSWAAGHQVTVRGFCKGMLMDVILQRCQAVQ